MWNLLFMGIIVGAAYYAISWLQTQVALQDAEHDAVVGGRSDALAAASAPASALAPQGRRSARFELPPEARLSPATNLRRYFHMPPDVARELAVAVDLILRDFVMPWYKFSGPGAPVVTGFSDDPQFLEYTQFVLTSVLGSLASRAAHVHPLVFLIDDALEAVRRHLHWWGEMERRAALLDPALFTDASDDELLVRLRARAAFFKPLSSSSSGGSSSSSSGVFGGAASTGSRTVAATAFLPAGSAGGATQQQLQQQQKSSLLPSPSPSAAPMSHSSSGLFFGSLGGGGGGIASGGGGGSMAQQPPPPATAEERVALELERRTIEEARERAIVAEYRRAPGTLHPAVDLSETILLEASPSPTSWDAVRPWSWPGSPAQRKTLAYCRGITAQLLPLLLPPVETHSHLQELLLREITASSVLAPLLSNGEPATVNWMIGYALDELARVQGAEAAAAAAAAAAGVDTASEHSGLASSSSAGGSGVGAVSRASTTHAAGAGSSLTPSSTASSTAPASLFRRLSSFLKGGGGKGSSAGGDGDKRAAVMGPPSLPPPPASGANGSDPSSTSSPTRPSSSSSASLSRDRSPVASSSISAALGRSPLSPSRNTPLSPPRNSNSQQHAPPLAPSLALEAAQLKPASAAPATLLGFLSLFSAALTSGGLQPRSANAPASAADAVLAVPPASSASSSLAGSPATSSNNNSSDPEAAVAPAIVASTSHRRPAAAAAGAVGPLSSLRNPQRSERSGDSNGTSSSAGGGGKPSTSQNRRQQQRDEEGGEIVTPTSRPSVTSSIEEEEEDAFDDGESDADGEDDVAPGPESLLPVDGDPAELGPAPAPPPLPLLKLKLGPVPALPSPFRGSPAAGPATQRTSAAVAAAAVRAAGACPLWWSVMTTMARWHPQQWMLGMLGATLTRESGLVLMMTTMTARLIATRACRSTTRITARKPVEASRWPCKQRPLLATLASGTGSSIVARRYCA